MKTTRWSLGWRILGTACLCLAGRAMPAAALDKPAGLAVDASAGPLFTWNAVDQAGLYRVAVFDSPDVEGKRLLLAAVWVSGTAWAYGDPPSVASAAHLPSTRPLPLPAGHKVRVMVAAARGDGMDKSDWSGTDFGALGTAPVAAPPSPSPSPTLVAAHSVSPSSDAELDLGGADEFKASPDPAVIDVQDNTRAASGAPAAEALSPSASSASASVAAPAPSGDTGTGMAASDPLAAAKALLAAGKPEQAEAAFRALLDQDAKNAEAWEGLGDSYVAQSMKVEAASAYEKALQLDASNDRLKQWMQKNVRY